MSKAKIYGMKCKCIPNRDADRIHGKAMARGWAKKPAPPIHGRGDGKSTIHLKKFVDWAERST